MMLLRRRWFAASGAVRAGTPYAAAHCMGMMNGAMCCRRCISSSSSSSSSTSSTASYAASGGHARQPAATSAERADDDENIFSTAQDAAYASKMAGTLRQRVFQPGFHAQTQRDGAALTEKDEALVRMWREMNNNPELDPTLAESRRGKQDDAQPQAESSGDGAGDTAKKSLFQDEVPVNVAEVYGKTFKDTRTTNPSESSTDKRRRLIYQSRYRGMVEMDLILGHFARCRLETLDTELLDEYDVLLKQLDNDLFRWLIMGVDLPEDVAAVRCFNELKKFVETERHELLSSI